MVAPGSGRYLGGSDGAPPTPPPGGYRGAQRAEAHPFFGIPVETVPEPDSPAADALAIGTPTASAQAAHPGRRRRPSALGWIALVTTIVFAGGLGVLLTLGRTDALYSITVITLQLVVLAVVITALFSARARMLGAVSLAIVLLVNVGTVGGAGAVQTASGGGMQTTETAEDERWAAFPGIKGVPSAQILAQPSLEDVRENGDQLMAAVREALSERFGYTWVQGDAEFVRSERNGYGGESMLVRYSSQVWATTEPITDNERKREVMGVIDEVVRAEGMWGLILLNEPGDNGLDPAMLEKFYGSADPGTQVVWEGYSDNHPGPLRFYATLTDLSKDSTGEFRDAREAQTSGTDAPLQGLRLTVLAEQLLSEKDRAEFTQRLQKYPGS